jgi:acyl-CoA synthetase (AMP-forming)/AMP-acid ligase II
MMMQAYEGDAPAAVAAWRNLWFHTSDRGRFDERGFLYFIDRMASSIRRGGENISPSEIGQVLCNHPAIAAAAVVGVPDPVMGQEIKAVIVLRPGASASAPELHEFALANMAAYMVPRFLEFATELPYTALGKLKQEELAVLTGGEWVARTIRSKT